MLYDYVERKRKENSGAQLHVTYLVAGSLVQNGHMVSVLFLFSPFVLVSSTFFLVIFWSKAQLSLIFQWARSSVCVQNKHTNDGEERAVGHHLVIQR